MRYGRGVFTSHVLEKEFWKQKKTRGKMVVVRFVVEEAHEPLLRAVIITRVGIF